MSEWSPGLAPNPSIIINPMATITFHCVCALPRIRRDSIIHPPSYIHVCMHAGTRVLLPSPYMHTHRHLHICMQGSECNRQQELPSSLHCSDRQADRQTDMRAHTHRDKTSRSIYPARQPASSYTLPLLVWTWLAPCLACLLALVGK